MRTTHKGLIDNPVNPLEHNVPPIVRLFPYRFPNNSKNGYVVVESECRGKITHEIHRVYHYRDKYIICYTENGVDLFSFINFSS